MKLLICDDEPQILENMVNMTKAFDAFPISVYRAGTSLEALSLIQRESFDAVILDIDIDERNGIELAKMYRKYSPRGLVVFATSYESYAFEAFQVEALKYLIKPISKDDFEALLNFINLKLEEQMFIENHMSKTIAIRVDGEQILLRQSEIIYIEKIGKKAVFYTLNGRFEVRETIKDIHLRLSDDMFLKSHQGYLINVDRIYKLERYTVYMGDEKMPVPVSKANVENVQNAIKRKLWGD